MANNNFIDNLYIQPVSYLMLKNHSSEEVSSITEYFFYSDCHVVGQVDDESECFEFHNTISGPNKNIIRRVLLVRIKHKDLAYYKVDMTKTKTIAYHGGEFTDEIAAIISLYYGVRILSGPLSRTFEDKSDKVGRPLELDFGLPHVNLDFINNTFHTSKSFHIKYDVFNKLKLLTPEEATVFIRASRSYQKALWLASSDPELSWIFLVAAIETIAEINDFENDNDEIDEFEILYPALFLKLCESDNEDLLSFFAKELNPRSKSTKKFINFLIKYLPEPPEKRPSSSFCLEWTTKELQKKFSKIYMYRSLALHRAIPFPHPMCFRPLYVHQGVPEEKPIGLATRTKNGIWTSDDLPMHLHMFEYIVRKAIIKWFDEKVESGYP